MIKHTHLCSTFMFISLQLVVFTTCVGVNGLNISFVRFMVRNNTLQGTNISYYSLWCHNLIKWCERIYNIGVSITLLTIEKCASCANSLLVLTHCGRVTNICLLELTIIGSDNGLSPHRRQAIIWTNVGILLIGPLRTNFSETLIAIHIFSFKKMHLKMSSDKWRPFFLGLNVFSPG